MQAAKPIDPPAYVKSHPVFDLSVLAKSPSGRRADSGAPIAVQIAPHVTPQLNHSISNWCSSLCLLLLLLVLFSFSFIVLAKDHCTPDGMVHDL